MPIPEYGQRAPAPLTISPKKHDVDHHGHTDKGEAEGEGNEIGVVAPERNHTTNVPPASITMWRRIGPITPIDEPATSREEAL